MERHITFIAVVNIALSILGLGAAFIIFLVMVGSGIVSGDALPFAITSFIGTAIALVMTSFIGTAIALVMTIFSALSIFGSIGLLKHKSWARMLMLILSVFDLFGFPIGTLIGVYTIWVLLNSETARLFNEPVYAA